MNFVHVLIRLTWSDDIELQSSHLKIHPDQFELTAYSSTIIQVSSLINSPILNVYLNIFIPDDLTTPFNKHASMLYMLKLDDMYSIFRKCKISSCFCNNLPPKLACLNWWYIQLSIFVSNFALCHKHCDILS